MAYYNPYLSYGYQGPMQTQPVPQPQAQPAQQTGVNWVQGEAGARSWLTAPNTTVLLMDSESERFYIKSTDASGMPLPLRVFEYKERTGAASGSNPIGAGNYVTREEFEAFRQELLYGKPEKRSVKDEPAV